MVEEILDNEGRVYLRVEREEGPTVTVVKWSFMSDGATLTSHEQVYEDPIAAKKFMDSFVESHRDWMRRLQRAHP